MDVDDTGMFQNFMLTFFGVTMESHLGVTLEFSSSQHSYVAEAYGSRTHQGPRRATPQPF